MDDPLERTLRTIVKPRGGGEEKKQKGELIHVKAATTASRLRDAKSGHGVSRRSLARELIQKREEEEEEAREHAPQREEKDEPVPTEVSSKLTGPWLLWASECLARGPGFRYPGQPQQERSSGGGNKKVSLERT